MLPQTDSAAPRGKKQRKKLLVAVALASGVTLECSSAGIGLFDSGLGCQPTTGFSSSCAIADVTTTCGVSITCEAADGTAYTTCTLPTPASDCKITVSFENGTQQTIPVSVYAHGADCGSAGIYGVALPLQCKQSDAGDLDADDASEAEDAASDALVDAPAD